jgi:hypothetical protein
MSYLPFRDISKTDLQQQKSASVAPCKYRGELMAVYQDAQAAPVHSQNSLIKQRLKLFYMRKLKRIHVSFRLSKTDSTIHLQTPKFQSALHRILVTAFTIVSCVEATRNSLLTLSRLTRPPIFADQNLLFCQYVKTRL